MRHVKTIYLFGIHLLLAILVVDQMRPIAALDRLLPVVTPIEDSHYYRQLHGFYQRQMTQFARPTTVFVGDSLVQGWLTDSVGVPVANFGIGKDTIMGLTRRIAVYIKNPYVERMVVLVGINDLLNGASPVEIGRRIDALSQQFSARIPVYWLGVLPVAKQRVSVNGILEVNQHIERTCSRLTRCHYIAPATALTSSGFILDDEFHIGDGLHLNYRGYQILSDRLSDILLSDVVVEDVHHAR